VAPAAEIRGLVKRFGDQWALEPFDATLEAGRLTGLVGPDGAGKTTLLRILAALMTPTEGRVRVMGLDVVEDARRIHSVVGYMPQRFGLYEDLSVMENLRLYSRLRGLRGPELEETFERLLHFTRLEPFTSRLAGRLSGGMKQKLGLACALMAQPDLLLLDEPSVGVDPVSRRELWRMVQELTGGGMAVVWSTAYLDEAERCDSVLLLNGGRLEYDGPPKELTRRIAGRSYRIVGVGEDRRGLLARVLDLEPVRDGVIQGTAVRAVLEEGADPAVLDDVVARSGGRVEPVAPRFEDAFIDLLGGGPGGRSVLAEKMDPVELDSEVAVEARRLTKRFGAFTAADGVDFKVKEGEVFGLLGPNGAGKSTTFKMLCGLLTPTSGEARVTGFDLRHAPGAAKRQLGYMAQKFSLYGLLSVRQNLEFFSGAYGLSGRTRRRRIEEMIETFGLDRYLDESPTTLPLGYKQRLALACALMHRPPVLFLDEPTSGVDPITRREFWTHINGLVRKGATVLVTTHFMDEAEYCDRVALMFRSRVIALDSPDRLKARAVSETAPDPTMEDAFIALVEAADVPEDRRAAA
jgi:ABC-2 type transport system ATP-binding protein